MALITENQARSAAIRSEGFAKKASSQILRESAGISIGQYDVFLSHSFADARLINGVRELLIEVGLTVYVDWIDDRQLDRSSVTKATADLLRNRMRSCKTLVYAHSENSVNSKWMPWEVGYFDALKGRVSILPLVREARDSFAGTEFLGLYPWVDIARLEGSSSHRAFVNLTTKNYNTYTEWMRTGELPAHS